MVRIALSETHPKAGLIVGRDLQAWAVFILLALATASFFPLYIVALLVVMVTILCAVYIYYMHFYHPETKTVSATAHVRAVHRKTRWDDRLLFIASCFSTLAGVYLLYRVGYLSGNYDTLVTIINQHGGHSAQLPELRSGIATGMFCGILTVADGFIAFMVLVYEKIS
jgi:Ca2+/Na+ antiporter